MFLIDEMPTKVQLEKAAWKWVDEVTQTGNITGAHVETAYRCNLQQCPQGECKRNCRGNPFCLNGLGEKRWFEELDESKWHEFDPEGERRSEGHFVGLKNLGATCYVNTFLQLWFHNERVRRAVYEWRDPYMLSEPDADWKPTSICGHLQLIFGLLQHSKRAYIDPSPLIECLGLSPREQQDAQEFSKLFLSVLEGALSQSTLEEHANIIQEQFAGTYSYVTKCQACGSESSREAKFYELDINICGHTSLQGSLQDFLKEEKLEGENQYMCSFCNCKQNAVRSIRLNALPPVLNLQLLRFVFDVKKGQKKKLNSFLQFGDTLDMSQYLQQPDNTVVYDLSAVLIHRGTSAYSGHYVAHILDSTSKLWYRFNDEEIAVMKGRRLQLGKEEEISAGDPLEGSSAEKVPRVAKGMHSSRNAYMLVYSRREPAQNNQTEPSICTVQSTTTGAATETAQTTTTETSPAEPPPSVLQYIAQDNNNFEEWVQDIALTRDANIFSGKEQQQRIQQIYKSLHRNSDEESFEWMPYDWLNKWLTDPEKMSEINCAQYLCSHKRLHPDMVAKMKIVSTEGAEQLYSVFKGGPRLKGKDALCEECVRHRWLELHFKNLLADHAKFFNTALRQPTDSSPTCYWVGKGSLRSWKRLAKVQFDKIHSISGCDDISSSNIGSGDEEGENGTENGNSNGSKSYESRENDDEEKADDGEKIDGDGMGDAENDDADLSSTQCFNSDLLCDEHGDLQPNEMCRRLVPDTVWKRLRCLFPTCPEFPRDAAVCQKCTEQIEKEQEMKVTNRQWYAAQRQALQDLYSGRNRPKPPDLGDKRVFVVSADFVEEWRKFIRNKEGSRRDPLTEIVNVPLLCNHSKLLYPVDQAEENDLVFVWEEEWKQLTECYSCDVTIEVFVIQQEDGQQIVVSVPEVCDSCIAERLQEEEEQKYTFEQAMVYVRKVVPSLMNSSTAATATDSDHSTKDDDDSEFQEVTKDAGDGEPPSAKKQKVDDANLRKSQRHRKQRGEKEVKVSSTMTLKDFKIKVMNLFSIPTFDQNLCLEGRPLTNNEATLKQLRFHPGCVVIVKADVASQDAQESVLDEVYSARKPEEGFKGTNLLSS